MHSSLVCLFVNQRHYGDRENNFVQGLNLFPYKPQLSSETFRALILMFSMFPASYNIQPCTWMKYRL
jgi:hypothetical protein